MTRSRCAAIAALLLCTSLVAACSSSVPITSPVTMNPDGTTSAFAQASNGPPVLSLWLSRDTVLEGDSIVASSEAFTGTKKSPSTQITWTWHAGWVTDTVPSIGALAITALNGKATDISIKGVRWGNVTLVAEWRDSRGALVTSIAAQLHVKTKVADVGVCFLDPHVADSLGISGDTSVDPVVVAPFCLDSLTLNAVRVRLRAPMAFLDTKRVP